MFVPVSTVEYLVLGADRQLLVCTRDTPTSDPIVRAKWQGRATALFQFAPDDDLARVVRDLLANPQIRAIVFDGEGAGDTSFRSLWRRETPPAWGIQEEHLELVRQYVDLFDEDCGLRGHLQPYWPERLRYVEKA